MPTPNQSCLQPRITVIYMSIAGVGSGGTVFFDRHCDISLFTFGSDGVVANTRSPAHISLTHELIHADRTTRGVIIPLNQWGSFSFEMARHPLSPLRIFGGPTRTVTHTFQLEEFATIGLRYFTTLCITENMIRQEHNLPLRASHRYTR